MDVLMPQLGETVAEGKIVKWFKQAGDAVTPGENLFEIETDKTSMEVPAIAAGTLTDIRFGVGETAKVGMVVAVIAGAGGAFASPAVAAPAPPPKAVEHKPVQQTPFVPAKAGTQSSLALDPRLRGGERNVGRDFAYSNMSPWREVRTPEQNYGPAKLPSGNYVTPLARRLASERGIDLSRVSGSGPHGRIVAADIASAPRASDAVAPVQFTLVADIEIGRLNAMRDEAKAGGAEFSLADFFIKAWAMTLKRVTPDAATDIGLVQNANGKQVTTMVRDAALKSLTAVAKESCEASPASGAMTSIHIVSKPGIREATAVLTAPATSALAIGQPRRVPAEAADGSIKFISQMTVTLTCDHRAIDSAVAEELLAAFKSLVENPVTALV